MTSLPSSVNYKEAAQAAAYAVVYQILCPENALSTIGTIALAEISCFGIDLASKGYQWVKETRCFYKLLYQDLQKLLDDADAYQEYLEMAPTLVSEEQIPLNTSQQNSEHAFVVLPKEILELIFSHLSIEDIVHFSEADKCCYLATRTDSIWERQLEKLFPKMECLPSEEYKLSPEQQVKIIYKRTWWSLKRSNEQLKKNTEATNQICKSNKINYSFLGEENILCKIEHQKLIQLVDDCCDGTDTSLDHFIQRKDILERIKQLKKDCETFATPEEFNKYILRARSALDTRKSLKDFPERVSKMKDLVDKNVFTDFFISTTFSSRRSKGASIITIGIGEATLIPIFTIGQICGVCSRNLNKIELDQMLEYKH